MVEIGDITEQIGRALNEAVSLVVANRAGDEIEARRVSLVTNAAESFRQFCASAAGEVSNRRAVPYDTAAELTDEEVFVIDDPSTLAELADVVDLAAAASTLPPIAPADLDLKIQLYGVVLGDTDRVVFVKKANPSVAYGGGKFFAIGRDSLRVLDEPAFSFSTRFDLIVSSSWAVVLDLSNFERLFRGIGIVDRHLTGWVSGITDHLPMSKGSIDALTDVARRDSRTWRKLRDIHARGHLAAVTVDMVVEYAKEMDLDPTAIVKDGELVFDPTDRFSFLHLLNEDLYRGALTSEAFEVQRKATAG